MVKAKYHQGVRVCENRFINRHLKSRLIHALKHGDRMASDFSDQLLEVKCGNMEYLQRAGDSLEEFGCTPLGCLILRPRYAPDLGHGRKAVIQFSDITVAFPWVAPRPVDTHPPCAGVFTG